MFLMEFNHMQSNNINEKNNFIHLKVVEKKNIFFLNIFIINFSLQKINKFRFFKYLYLYLEQFLRENINFNK